MTIHSITLVLALLIGFTGRVYADNVCAGEESPQMKLEPFALSQVRLLDGPCLTAQQADMRYLLELEPDRLLYAYRQSAGLPTPGKPSGGWEAPDFPIRGSFLGHYLSACAQMYASTGDETLKAKADALVAELARCQQAFGDDGYLSAHPRAEFDLFLSERVKGNYGTWGGWHCPLYMFHKTMAGLLEQYQLCGNQQALEVVEKLAGFFLKFNMEECKAMFGQEHGGFVEFWHNLYAETGNKQYLEMGERLLAIEPFLAPLAEHQDKLDKCHANSNIPVVIGAARNYELTGNEQSRAMVDYFAGLVMNTRAYATGGTSTGEAWREANRLAYTLSDNNQESCTSYNMLKLTHKQLCWTGEVRYADYQERLFFNGILGTQNPQTSMLIYYMPLASGFKKVFSTPYDSMWCCCGTGCESFAKIGDSIYYHDKKNLFVSLYIASQVEWPGKGVRVEQRTQFPEEQGSTFIIHAKQSVRFGLNLHAPYWAAGGVEVRVNGKKIDEPAQPGAWFRIERRWKEGDKVQIALPMSLHAHPMPDDANLMALMYGPLVLATPTEQDVLLMADPEQVDTWLKPVDGKALMFRTVGVQPELVFSPLNRVMDDIAYGVYVRVYKPESAEYQKYLDEQRAKAEKLKQQEARVIDRVAIQDEASEAAHHLQGEKTATGGPVKGKSYRQSEPEGWFSWDFKVLPDQPMTLLITYWGSDSGCDFAVSVDGHKITEERFIAEFPSQFFSKEYPIPQEWTQGKEKATVKIEAIHGAISGRIFGCATMKP